MPTDEHQALDALGKGASFNVMCVTLAKLMPEEEVPLRAAGLLKGWLAQGLISGIKKNIWSQDTDIPNISQI